MASVRKGGRRRRHAEGHDDAERWLLTYADMITLLLALFVVLFAVSSVNTSKYQALQDSLRDAFSGRIVTGGEEIMETGSSATRETQTSAIPNIAPTAPQIGEPRTAASKEALAARQEQNEFERIKHQLDAYAASHGFRDQVETVVARRGLVVRLLTDHVLFDSGLADLKAQGTPLLAQVANMLAIDTQQHPIVVEGHTDDVPISTSQFASNWELSTARATEVVRYLIGRGLPRERFGASGYADLHPLASNATDGGRARNRRVEVVLQRLHQPPPGADVAPETPKGIAP